MSSLWRPLLRRPIFVCSFLDNFDSSLRSDFSPFMPCTQTILPWVIFPSGTTPDGGFRRVVVVSSIFLIGYSSNFWLVRLPSHAPLPRNGLDTSRRLYVILRHKSAATRHRMSLLSALWLLQIGGLRNRAGLIGCR